MKKPVIKKPNTQMPINQESLMHLSFFISYCEDNGLKINKDRLEELHKFGLVFPALKIYLGIVEHRKIFANIHEQDGWYYVSPKDLSKFKVIKLDKKKYYSVGGLSKFRSTWLDYYFENGMTEMPSKHKFSPWQQKQYPGYYTNASTISKQYQFLYDEKQILAIKIALPHLGWLKVCNPINRQGTILAIQKRISDLYKFFEIYNEMEKLYTLFQEERKKLLLRLKSHKDEKEKITRIEWGEEFDFTIFPQFKKLTKEMVNKYKIDKDYLYDWRQFLASKSLINESGRSSKIKKEYIKVLNDDTIINLEDIHYMIRITNVFLYFLTGKEETVKQALGDFSYKICPICSSGFRPRNKEQITCGKVGCVKEHKNRSKKEQRKIEKIKGK